MSGPVPRAAARPGFAAIGKVLKIEWRDGNGGASVRA
jgi:hypothetical protein